MVVSHLILMPSSTASSASKACAGMWDAVAPVDDQRLVGAQTPRCPRRIHRGIAAAIDDHAAAQKRGFAGADVMQQRNRVEHPHGVARGNVDMLADIRADREEGGVKPPRRDFGQDVFNLVIEDDLHSHAPRSARISRLRSSRGRR